MPRPTRAQIEADLRGLTTAQQHSYLDEVDKRWPAPTTTTAAPARNPIQAQPPPQRGSVLGGIGRGALNLAKGVGGLASYMGRAATLPQRMVWDAGSAVVHGTSPVDAVMGDIKPMFRDNPGIQAVQSVGQEMSDASERYEAERGVSDANTVGRFAEVGLSAIPGYGGMRRLGEQAVGMAPEQDPGNRGTTIAGVNTSVDADPAASGELATQLAATVGTAPSSAVGRFNPIQRAASATATGARNLLRRGAVGEVRAQLGAPASENVLANRAAERIVDSPNPIASATASSFKSKVVGMKDQVAALLDDVFASNPDAKSNPSRAAAALRAKAEELRVGGEVSRDVAPRAQVLLAAADELEGRAATAAGREVGRRPPTMVAEPPTPSPRNLGPSRAIEDPPLGPTGPVDVAGPGDPRIPATDMRTLKAQAQDAARSGAYNPQGDPTMRTRGLRDKAGVLADETYSDLPQARALGQAEADLIRSVDWLEKAPPTAPLSTSTMWGSTGARALTSTARRTATAAVYRRISQLLSEGNQAAAANLTANATRAGIIGSNQKQRQEAATR